MFEAWQSEADPTVYVVLVTGGTLPPEFAGDAFMCMGECRVPDDVAAAVRRDEFAMVKTDVPFDAEGVLGERRDK